MTLNFSALLKGKQQLPDVGVMRFLPLRLYVFTSDMTIISSTDILCCNGETGRCVIVETSQNEDYYMNKAPDISAKLRVVPVETVYIKGSPEKGFKIQKWDKEDSRSSYSIRLEHDDFDLSILDIFPEDNDLRLKCVNNIFNITVGEHRKSNASDADEFQSVYSSFPGVSCSWTSVTKSAKK